MKTFIFFMLMFGAIISSNSQNVRLNQLDSSGKKDGKWVIYLNMNWKSVKDSSNASFYRYAYYYKGINIDQMGWCRKKWKVIHSGGNNSQVGRIKALDGEYTWMDNKGKTMCIANFNNGECLSFKWFYSSGLPQSVWDYTKKYDGQIHSYWISIYDRKGNVKEYYFRKNRQCISGWYVFPASND
jgi:hypothetical protein